MPASTRRPRAMARRDGVLSCIDARLRILEHQAPSSHERALFVISSARRAHELLSTTRGV